MELESRYTVEISLTNLIEIDFKLTDASFGGLVTRRVFGRVVRFSYLNLIKTNIVFQPIVFDSVYFFI